MPLFRMIYPRDGILRGITFYRDSHEGAKTFARSFCKGWSDQNKVTAVVPVKGRLGSPADCAMQELFKEDV